MCYMHNVQQSSSRPNSRAVAGRNIYPWMNIHYIILYIIIAAAAVEKNNSISFNKHVYAYALSTFYSSSSIIISRITAYRQQQQNSKHIHQYNIHIHCSRKTLLPQQQLNNKQQQQKTLTCHSIRNNSLWIIID